MVRKVMVVLVAALVGSACAGTSPEPIATGVPQAPADAVVQDADSGPDAEDDDTGTEADAAQESDTPAVDTEAAEALAERISEAATFEPLKEADCFGYPAVLGARFRCSTFYVPADPAAPDSRLLGLEVVRIGRIGSQSAGRADKSPAVFVQGGPGASVLDLVSPLWEDVFEPLSAERDLIVVDQRGTGFSDPFVFCESVIAGFEENFRRFSTDIPQQVLDRSADCRDAALRQIELDIFSAAASARDLVALREAMGFDHWHVFGVSHGTRVALEMAAIDRAGTASLVLDSLDPLGTSAFALIPETLERSLERVYADCGADADCASQFGAGFEQLPDVVEGLNDSPLFVEQDFGPRLRVDGGVFMSLIHQFLYSPDGARTVPQLISDAVNGDTERLELVLSISPGFFGATSEFVLLAHNCVDEDVDAFVPPAEPDLYDLVSTHAVLATHAAAVCDVLGLEHRPREHELTDTPTLVMAGDYDPITSPVLAEAFAAELSDAAFVLVPYSGHGPSLDGECTLGVVTAFMADPGEDVDTACIDDIEPPAFTVDESLVPEVGVFTLSDGLTTVTGTGPTDWFEEDAGFQLIWSRNRNALDSAILSVLVEQITFDTGQAFVEEIRLIFPDAEVVDNGAVEIGGLEWQEIRTVGAGLQGTFRRWTDGEAAVVVFVLGLTEDLADLEPLLDDVTESIEIDTGG